jgi:hypothetical protein
VFGDVCRHEHLEMRSVASVCSPELQEVAEKLFQVQ